MGQLSFKSSAGNAAGERREEIRLAAEWHSRWLFNSVRADSMPTRIRKWFLTVRPSFSLFMPSTRHYKTFLYSLEGSLDENRELPGHFLHELYKWALECKSTPKNSYQVSHFSCFAELFALFFASPQPFAASRSTLAWVASQTTRIPNRRKSSTRSTPSSGRWLRSSCGFPSGASTKPKPSKTTSARWTALESKLPSIKPLTRGDLLKSFIYSSDCAWSTSKSRCRSSIWTRRSTLSTCQLWSRFCARHVTRK